MDPDIVEQLNEQFREMSDILSQQNSLMAAQVRNMQSLSSNATNAASAFNDSTNSNASNIKSTRQLADEQDKTSASSRGFSRALDFAANSVMTFGKTVMDSNHNFQKYNNVVDTVSGAVSDLGRDFGIVGQVLGGIVKAGGEMLKYQLTQADSLLKFNDSVSKMGAMNSFTSGQISEMGLKAGFAAKDLDKLTAPIEKLGTTFKIIGNGATDSTKRFMEMAAVGSDIRQEFQRLGYSQTELVEAQTGYIELLGGSGLALRSFNNDVKTLQKTSLEYVKNLQILSEMSGLTAEEQQKRMAAAAADTQFQLYIADMNKKIAAATTEEEKVKLTNQVQLAMATKAQITALQGEDAGRGFGQALAGAPMTEGLDTMAVSGTLDNVQDLANKIREGSIDSAREAARYTQAITNSSATAQDSLKVAAAISSDVAKLLGGTTGIAERNRLFGLDQEKLAADIDKRIKDNEKGEGPGATDELQVARNELTEAEIRLRTEFDNFAKEISVAVPAMKAMASAANLATGAFKAMKPPGDFGPGIFAGILAAAGLGTAGIAAFRALKTMSSLKGGAVPGAVSIPGTATSTIRGAMPVGNGMFKTPGGILLDPKQAEAYNSLHQQRVQATGQPSVSHLDRIKAAGRGGLGALGRGAMGLLRFAGPLGLVAAGGYGLYGAGQGFMADEDASFGSKLLNAGSSGLNALSGGLLGRTPEEIAAAKSGRGVPDKKNNLLTPEDSFARAVRLFGSLTTSFGRIVAAFGKGTKNFGVTINSLKTKLNELDKLSPNKGKISSQFTEDEELIEYIDALKTQFNNTAKSNENLREAEIVRHQFNEISMSKFRQSIDVLTEKFDILAKSQVFGLSGVDDIGGGSSGISGNAGVAMDYFMQQGWSKAQAAGIVGNLQAESNLDPNAIAKNDAGKGKHSYGIAQWNKGRFENLKRFASQRGKDWNDFQTQLEFVQHELMGSESAAASALRSVGTAEEAAAIFDQKFERSTGEHRNKRVAFARDLMNSRDNAVNFSGGIPPGTSEENLVRLGQMLEKSGLRVSGHSQFGGRPSGGHSKNSRHYKDLAIDINAPGGINEANDPEWRQKFDYLAASLKQAGYAVLWRHDKGHQDHIHASIGPQYGSGTKIKAAQGGIFDGPTAGYPAELHGSEMVAPLDTNSILMKLATTPAATTEETTISNNTRLERETIEKISIQSQETMSELINKINDLIDAVIDGNDDRRKMLNNTML